MIAYFDTSALLPLVVAEPATPVARDLFDLAERIASAVVAYAEGRAAIAQAGRTGRIEQRRIEDVVARFDAVHSQLHAVTVDARLAQAAGDLAQRFGLRGYDAVHLATAAAIADDETVFVSGDAELCDAAGRLGLAVARTT